MFEARQKANERTQILDDASRMRRQKKALEALEKDNFQETPTFIVSEYKLQLNKKFQQKFSVEADKSGENSNANLNLLNETAAKKRKLKPESKLRYRKTFNNLLEEEVSTTTDIESVLSVILIWRYFSQTCSI